MRSALVQMRCVVCQRQLGISLFLSRDNSRLGQVPLGLRQEKPFRLLACLNTLISHIIKVQNMLQVKYRPLYSSSLAT